MKFTKHQKDIIKRISNGEIFNIFTYLKSFNLGELVRYNKNQIIDEFNNDDLPKTYYYPINIKPRLSNIISESDFTDKIEYKKVNAENYTFFNLTLSYNQGIKHEVCNDKIFEIDFYEGVYIAKSFENIIEFLSLWQYLKSEMLVLEVPSNFSTETLGLFYEKKLSYSTSSQVLPLQERIKRIDFNTLTYDDKYYINNNIYELSCEHFTICKEYLDRQIYPTPKLKIFIQKGFKSIEEKTQSSALLAAWLAIFITIILTFIPFFRKADIDYLQDIELEIRNIQDSLITNKNISAKLDVIIKRLDSLSSQHADILTEEQISTTE